MTITNEYLARDGNWVSLSGGSDIVPRGGAGPAPTASFTYSPAAPATGETVTFDGSASTGTDIVIYFDAVLDPADPDATALGTYELGTANTNGILEFAFSSDGDKHVRCTVTDSSDRTADTVDTLTVSGTATRPQSAPTVSGTVVDTSTINWSWTQVLDAAGYERRSRTGDGVWSPWVDAGTATSWTDSGHSAGTTRTVQVYAYNANGDGPVGEATATTGTQVSGTFDADNYATINAILFPTDRSQVGIAGAGLTGADLTFIDQGNLTVKLGRNDGNVVNNFDTAAGTESDPFIVSRRDVNGGLTFDGQNGAFYVKVVESRIHGGSFYGIFATGGVTILSIEDCTIGQPDHFMNQAAMAGVASTQILRVDVSRCGDVAKLADGTVIEDCYFTNDEMHWNADANDYKHVDSLQQNDNNEGTIRVRRTYMDCGTVKVGGPQAGETQGGNANWQQKPGDDKQQDLLVEDSYLGGGNSYSLNWVGNNHDPASVYVARRCILEPFGDSWVTGGSDGILTGTSQESAGPNTSVYTLTDLYRFDGTRLD